MIATITQQAAYVVEAPIPFLVITFVVAGIVWRVLKWRYDSIIDGLEHRISLRDDTIKRYEQGGPTAEPLVKSTTSNINETTLNNKEITTPEMYHDFTSSENGRQHFVAPTVTPNDLRQIYSNVTDIQAIKQARIYLGKWIQVTGIVRSVYEHSSDKIRLRLIDAGSDDIGLRGIWLTFDSDQSTLETLKQGDSLVAIGVIKEISQFDINLENCKLIKVS